MRKTSSYWAKHLAAIEESSISTSQYARMHGIKVHSLYSWRNRLKNKNLTDTVATKSTSKPALNVERQTSRFVAMQIEQDILSVNQNALNAPLSQGLNPDLLVQLQQYIDDSVQQQIKEQESNIRAEIESELRSKIENEIASKYQKKFDEELARGITNGVAEQVREIIEQARLARIRTYGPKNESSAQLSLFNEVELINEEYQNDLPEAEVIVKTKSAKKKPRGHRRPLPPELPRLELVVDIKESDRIDANGKPMVRIGEEISEKLDIIPMKIRVIRTIRPKYAPADGNGSPIIAKAPPSVLPRANLSASALAMLILQ